MRFVGLGLSLLLILAWPKSVYAQPAQLTEIFDVVGKIIELLAPAAAIAFLIMLIIGSYQFITAGGDPKGAAGARATLTYAVIGVVLVVTSWLILQLIQTITGANVTTVTFPK